MKCFYCNEEIVLEPYVKELKVNNSSKIIKRYFCSDYCCMRWELSSSV